MKSQHIKVYIHPGLEVLILRLQMAWPFFLTTPLALMLNSPVPSPIINHCFCSPSRDAVPKNSIPGALVSIIQGIGTILSSLVKSSKMVISLLNSTSSRYTGVHRASFILAYSSGLTCVRYLLSCSSTFSSVKRRSGVVRVCPLHSSQAKACKTCNCTSSRVVSDSSQHVDTRTELNSQQLQVTNDPIKVVKKPN